MHSVARQIQITLHSLFSSSLVYFSSTMPPKETGRKAQAARSAATPQKRAMKAASRRQVPVISPQAPEHSFDMDDAC